MATYNTDLSLFDAADSAGNWAELSGHSSGGAPSADTENYMQNSISVSQATGQASGTNAGMECDYGSAISWTSGWVIMAWQYYAAPTNLNSWANGGMRFGIGSSTGNMSYWNAMGDDFGGSPYACWQNTAIDPETTPDGTDDGSPTGDVRLFGSLPNVRAKISKGSPHACDIIRYGRGEIYATGTGGTFAGYAAANDTDTARWGLFQKVRGGYLWKGLFSFGQSGTSLAFSDSNVNIFIDDTPRVAAGFNTMQILNSSSSVSLTGITISGVGTSITGSAPISPGDFDNASGATLMMDSCTFVDMGTFDFDASTYSNTITDTIFRRCGQVTQGGAVIDGCLFSNCPGTVSLLVNNLNSIDNCDFVSAGTNHAIKLTSDHAGNSYTLTNCTYTGYAGTDGSTGNECIFNDSGGAVTINVDGGDTPTIRNGSGASTNVVAGSVTVTIKAQTASGTAISGASVFLRAANGTGSLPFQADVSISNSGTLATVTHTGHNMLTNDKVLIENSDVAANNGVFSITWINANSYSYTMGSSPGTNPTTTPTATYVALKGTTDGDGEISTSRVFSTAQPVTGWARKASSAPYYKEGPVSGTISTSENTNFTAIMATDG